MINISITVNVPFSYSDEPENSYGYRGEPHVTGPVGPQGVQGIQGPQGLMGPKGDPGVCECSCCED